QGTAILWGQRIPRECRLERFLRTLRIHPKRKHRRSGAKQSQRAALDDSRQGAQTLLAPRGSEELDQQDPVSVGVLPRKSQDPETSDLVLGKTAGDSGVPNALQRSEASFRARVIGY